MTEDQVAEECVKKRLAVLGPHIECHRVDGMIVFHVATALNPTKFAPLFLPKMDADLVTDEVLAEGRRRLEARA